MKEIMIKTIKYWKNTEVSIYPYWQENGRYKVFLKEWETGELIDKILLQLKQSWTINKEELTK